MFVSDQDNTKKILCAEDTDGEIYESDEMLPWEFEFNLEQNMFVYFNISNRSVRCDTIKVFWIATDPVTLS